MHRHVNYLMRAEAVSAHPRLFHKLRDIGVSTSGEKLYSEEPQHITP